LRGAKGVKLGFKRQSRADPSRFARLGGQRKTGPSITPIAKRRPRPKLQKCIGSPDGTTLGGYG
jgi:hypothetical protein